jgi:hypothetical protein
MFSMHPATHLAYHFAACPAGQGFNQANDSAGKQDAIKGTDGDGRIQLTLR